MSNGLWSWEAMLRYPLPTLRYCPTLLSIMVLRTRQYRRRIGEMSRVARNDVKTGPASVALGFNPQKRETGRRDVSIGSELKW